jgi:hypothetical protein
MTETYMASEKTDIPVKFLVSGRMWVNIKHVLDQEDYTLSEYLRELVRRDIRSRDQKIVSTLTDLAERDE